MPRINDEDERGGTLGIYIFADDEEPKGARIEKVLPGSPAEKAKLRAGDVIVAMNGEKVRSSADLAKRLGKIRAGETVSFKVMREEFERELKIKADPRPEAAQAAKPWLGIFAVPAPGGRGLAVDEVVAGGPAAAAGGSLKVVTTGMKPGYLRKNGVPYSADAVITEYFDRFSLPGGDALLVVQTEVVDPAYLSQPFWTSTHFTRQADAADWSPTPCRAQ